MSKQNVCAKAGVENEYKPACTTGRQIVIDTIVVHPLLLGTQCLSERGGRYLMQQGKEGSFREDREHVVNLCSCS